MKQNQIANQTPVLGYTQEPDLSTFGSGSSKHLRTGLGHTLICLMFFIIGFPSFSHAQTYSSADLKQMSTDQVVQALHSTDATQRRLAGIELNGRRDAFIPLLNVIATEQDTAIRDAALFPCSCSAPSFGEKVPPEAQDAVNAAIPVLLKMATQPQIPSMTLQLLRRIATPQQLLPTLREWLAPGRNMRAVRTGGHDQYMIAMEILTGMPKDAPPEAVQLVADQVDGPYMSEQVMNFLSARMPDTEPILLKMIRTGAKARAAAITALEGGRSQVLKFSPEARSAIEGLINDPQPAVVESAIHALIDPRHGAGPDILPKIAARLSEPRLRPTIAKVLRDIDPNLTTPVLVPMLTTKDVEVRRAVVSALCRQDYGRYQMLPPVRLFDFIDDTDPQIVSSVCNFVGYADSMNAFVGPVINQKAFRFRSRQPIEQPQAVPPYIVPVPATPAGASTWTLPPLLSPTLYALSFLVWGLLALIALGSIADRLMKNSQTGV